MTLSSQRQSTVTCEYGLHLRAASALVQVAMRFDCDITLKRDTQVVDAKSIMSVLSLAAGKGSVLWVCAQGTDAPGAVDAVANFIAAGFVH